MTMGRNSYLYYEILISLLLERFPAVSEANIKGEAPAKKIFLIHAPFTGLFT